MLDAREFWTAERVALLMRLRDDGLAYAAIAARLGVTRNAISGKVDRLGLSTRERLPREPRKPRPVLKRRPVGAASTANVEGGAVVAEAAHSGRQEAGDESRGASGERAEAPCAGPSHSSGRGPSACGLLDLNDRTCRWPVGDPAGADFFFCGELRQAPGPYCAAHRRLAYRPFDQRPMSEFEPDRRASFVLQPDTRFGQFADWDVS